MFDIATEAAAPPVHRVVDRWASPPNEPRVYVVACACGIEGTSSVGYLAARQDMDVRHVTREVAA